MNERLVPFSREDRSVKLAESYLATGGRFAKGRAERDGIYRGVAIETSGLRFQENFLSSRNRFHWDGHCFILNALIGKGTDGASNRAYPSLSCRNRLIGHIERTWLPALPVWTGGLHVRRQFTFGG